MSPVQGVCRRPYALPVKSVAKGSPVHTGMMPCLRADAQARPAHWRQLLRRRPRRRFRRDRRRRSGRPLGVEPSGNLIVSRISRSPGQTTPNMKASSRTTTRAIAATIASARRTVPLVVAATTAQTTTMSAGAPRTTHVNTRSRRCPGRDPMTCSIDAPERRAETTLVWMSRGSCWLLRTRQGRAAPVGGQAFIRSRAS